MRRRKGPPASPPFPGLAHRLRTTLGRRRRHFSSQASPDSPGRGVGTDRPAARRLHGVLTDRSDTARLETHCSPRRAGLDARGTDPLLLSEAGGPWGFLSADSPQLKRTALPADSMPLPEQLLRGWCGPAEAWPVWAGLTVASEGRPGLRVPASRVWRAPPPAARSCCFDSLWIEGAPWALP